MKSARTLSTTLTDLPADCIEFCPVECQHICRDSAGGTQNQQEYCRSSYFVCGNYQLLSDENSCQRKIGKILLYRVAASTVTKDDPRIELVSKLDTEAIFDLKW